MIGVKKNASAITKTLLLVMLTGLLHNPYSLYARGGWGGGFGTFALGGLAGGLIGSSIARNRSPRTVYVTQPAPQPVVYQQPVIVKTPVQTPVDTVDTAQRIKALENQIKAQNELISTQEKHTRILIEQNELLKQNLNKQCAQPEAAIR